MPPFDPAWDDWKKFLLTLPDGAFFSLARHYLGELKTPFTKQQILQDLLAHFNLPEWRQAVRELLCREDLEILTAIHSMDHPLPEEVATFFGRTGTQFMAILLNLQERLLIFVKPGRRGGSLALTPLAEENEELMKVLNPSLLYPSVSTPVNDTIPLLHEGTLLALLSFLQDSPLEKGASGAWKKKSREDFVAKFSGLGDHKEFSGAEALLKCAENLGLVLWEEGQTRVVLSYWSDLAKQPRSSRLALLWSSAGVWEQGPLFEAARWFWSFLSSLSPRQAYTLESLLRIAGRFPSLGTASQRKSLLEAWTRWGILVPASTEGHWQIPTSVFELGGDAEESPSACYLHANFELTAPHDVSLSQAIGPALCSKLTRWDKVIHWELSKPAVLKTLAGGWSSEQVEQALEKMTGRPVTQNVSFSLKEWEREFLTLRIWKGTVLQVDKSRLHMIEHTESFGKAVLQVLGEGLFLVREDLLKAWSKELEQKGLPALPPVVEPEAGTNWGSPWSFGRWKTEPYSLAQEEPSSDGPAFTPLSRTSGLLDRLRAKLAILDKTDEDREELEALIRRRVILTEEQLDHPINRGDRWEAKGIDYLGKLRLAEQAIASTADFLHIVTRDQEGKPKVLLIRPQKLEKHNNEIVLYGEELESRTPFRAFVSQLSLVKKIRGSLFP